LWGLFLFSNSLAGIYIHIPFCKQACTYCDFHFSVNTQSKEEMVKTIVLEIEGRKNYLSSNTIDTIYFGGGTPSILHASELEQILGKIYNEFDVRSNAEITIECNPDDLSKQKLKELKQLGFNRLSIGLQSFNDAELKWMNRAHCAKESMDCVKLAQDVGFDNITIDLIYGSKFQDAQTWVQTLQTALSLNVQHISAYNLTIEKKTKLGVDHLKQLEPAINDELSSEQFKVMIDLLQAHGFIHYEISNFGKEGFFSKHNSSYWLGSEYLGVGPSAHSFNGFTRQWNVSSNSAYISKLNKGEKYFEEELLQENEKYNEYILTRLRTIWGCNRSEIEERFGSKRLIDFDANVKKHNDYLVNRDNIITLNLEGKLRADFLASEFFMTD
jgi:oxygen-independent coproporphyrinogen-3 oxidase